MEYSAGDIKKATRILDRSVDGGASGPWTKLYDIKDEAFRNPEERVIDMRSYDL